jgi:hypothetical protein
MKLYKYLLTGSARHRWLAQPPDPEQDMSIFETTINGVYALGETMPLAVVEDEGIQETDIPGIYALNGMDIDAAIQGNLLREQPYPLLSE